MMGASLLRIEGLMVSFGDFKAVDGLCLEIPSGKVMGLVGESGSGKTVTALAILRLVPGKISGRIIFKGENLLELPEERVRKIRGASISMIFQDPSAALNPVLKIGYQVGEPLMVHRGYSRKRAIDEAKGLLSAVGIPDPDIRVRNYPHEFSGGMKQRAVIASAISCSPALLLADEPTTALDVTIQAQILNLLKRMKEKGTSILLISHDISIIAYLSDLVTIMCGGQDVESGFLKDVVEKPFHPYTRLLIESVGGRKAIPGSPADISQEGCKFAIRCPEAKKLCFEIAPERKRVERRFLRCHLF